MPTTAAAFNYAKREIITKDRHGKEVDLIYQTTTRPDSPEVEVLLGPPWEDKRLGK